MKKTPKPEDFESLPEKGKEIIRMVREQELDGMFSDLEDFRTALLFSSNARDRRLAAESLKRTLEDLDQVIAESKHIYRTLPDYCSRLDSYAYRLKDLIEELPEMKSGADHAVSLLKGLLKLNDQGETKRNTDIDI